VKSPAAAETSLSAAQRQVFVAVKRRGEASADDVADTLGITPSAVRQHLATLRTAGFVASRQERGRPGRPVDLYHSTEAGEALFSAPAAGDLSVELLGHVEEEDPELVPRIFQRRRRRRVEQCREKLQGRTLDGTVSGLAAILEAEGYMASVEKLPGDRYRLTLHSCAIWAVASHYSLACNSELEFLQDVLPDADIARVIHKVAGAYVCAYEIEARTSQAAKARPRTARAARRS